jgi:hypothetical protein
MPLLVLFPEILLEILQLCPLGDLASLSRAHTSLRDVADRILYGHISVVAWPWEFKQGPGKKGLKWLMDDMRSLLHTLSTNAQKAAMVKSLYIEFDFFVCNVEDAVRFLLVKLSDSLKNMSNLVDLRIVYGGLLDPSQGQISQVIRFVPSSLLS